MKHGLSFAPLLWMHLKKKKNSIATVSTDPDIHSSNLRSANLNQLPDVTFTFIYLFVCFATTQKLHFLLALNMTASVPYSHQGACT